MAMQTSGQILLDLIAGLARPVATKSAQIILGGNSRGTVLGGTSRGTVLGGTSRGTVLGGINRGNVLGGSSRGTVLGGTSRGTVLGGTSKGTVLGGTSAQSYTQGDPKPPKVQVAPVVTNAPRSTQSRQATAQSAAPKLDPTAARRAFGMAPTPNGRIAEPLDLNRRLAAVRDRNSRIASSQQLAPVKPTTGAAAFGVTPQAAAEPPEWKAQRAARRAQVKDRSTGNAYYDQLKSTVANQTAADRAERWKDFMAAQKGFTHPDDPSVAEAWAKHQKTWGQRLDSHPTLKRLVAGAYKPFAVGGMDSYAKGFSKDEQAGDMAHDAANMLQKQWGNWSQGVESFGRRVVGALDPRTWSSVSGPITSRVYSQAHANARANSDALQAAMNRKIDADNTGWIDPSSRYDKAYKVVSETAPRIHGEISAGTAAIGGAARVLGGAGGAITGAGAKLAPRAGQVAQRATSFLGNRVSSAIGRGTAATVRGTGRALATPFNMAARPVYSTGHTVAEGARGVGAVARPAAQTVRALMTPGRINYSNPSAWRTAANYWGGVLKPGAQTAWNALGNPSFFVTKQLGQAGWHALEDGDLGRAGGDLGGAYAWAGGFLPGMGYELYRGISDPYAE